MVLGFAEIFQEPSQIDNNKKIIETQSFYPRKWSKLLQKILEKHPKYHQLTKPCPSGSLVLPLEEGPTPEPQTKDPWCRAPRWPFWERDVFFPRKNNLPSMKKWETGVKFQFRISNKESMLFWMKYFQKHSTILKMPPQLASEKANMAATWA